MNVKETSITIGLTQKLKEIYDVLKSDSNGKENIGVLAGSSGISLFLFYYANFMNDDEVADLAAELISGSIEKINDGYTFPTFCSGIAGAGWVMELLSEQEFIDINNDELLTSLDTYLLHAMHNDIQKEYFDFLHGAMGYGYYFLKRFENTNSEDLKSTYKDYIIDLINGLKNAAIHDQNGSIHWKFKLSSGNNLKGGNLSLSHGISSVVSFLSRLYDHNDFKELVTDLIQGAIKYVLYHKKENLKQSAWYPSWIHPEIEEKGNSRLAWCYGDLGVGLSLWKAGRALDNQEYKQEALNIFKHSTKRRDLQEASVKDTGLCHGASGIAHIYTSMYLETKDDQIKEAADYWMKQLLEMAVHKDGSAGYMQWKNEEPYWEKQSNLLEGIAGIGLAIISYLDNELTQWDECLLINW